MNRKIVLGILGLVVLAVGYFAYQRMTTKSLSPPDVATLSSGDLEVQVDYCRPSKRDRLIFGNEEDGALQPYGKYWRAGANEATKLQINHKVNFGGSDLEAGTYALYAIPGPDTWTIALNSDAERWGASPPDPEEDVLRIDVPANNSAQELEQFEISLHEESAGVVLQLHWDRTQIRIPIQVIH